MQWDEEKMRRLGFEEILERLRQSHRDAPGELVDRLRGRRGSMKDSEGSCRWKTGSFHRAEVRCDFEIASLKGLVAARLGTTDPAMPFQGGGAPVVRAELRVREGEVALYMPASFDLMAIARQLSEVDSDTAERAGQPGDQFDGYRRLVARPGSPAVLTGEPGLLGSTVVLWLEAEGEARGLTLLVRPSQ